MGTPLLVRQDLVLDFVPAMDDKLKSAKDLSARWTSVLQAPLTGRYSFMFEGSGRVSIRIDGKVVFRKGSNREVRGRLELPLVKGQEYQVEVEACGMKAQQAFACRGGFLLTIRESPPKSWQKSRMWLFYS